MLLMSRALIIYDPPCDKCAKARTKVFCVRREDGDGCVRCQDTKQGCNFKKKKGRANAREANEVSEEMLAEVRGMRADVKEGLDRMTASLEAIAALGTKWWDRGFLGGTTSSVADCCDAEDAPY